MTSVGAHRVRGLSFSFFRIVNLVAALVAIPAIYALTCRNGTGVPRFRLVTLGIGR
jgi:hypothetical protein